MGDIITSIAKRYKVSREQARNILLRSIAIKQRRKKEYEVIDKATYKMDDEHLKALAKKYNIRFGDEDEEG
jgi:hypothetical protein